MCFHGFHPKKKCFLGIKNIQKPWFLEFFLFHGFHLETPGSKGSNESNTFKQTLFFGGWMLLKPFLRLFFVGWMFFRHFLRPPQVVGDQQLPVQWVLHSDVERRLLLEEQQQLSANAEAQWIHRWQR